MKNKETLEEASVNFAHNYFEMHESNNYQALKLGFKEGAKWKSERSYSKEEVEDIVNKTVNIFCSYFSEDLKQKVATEWFEQFKKPNTWYNEEQTNKRMNIV